MTNLPLEERVISVQDSDLTQGFDDALPSFRLRPPVCSWGNSVTVDPFRGYAHNRDLVLECASKIERAWPLEIAPYYYLLPLEAVGRTNGWCSNEWFQHENKEKGIPRKQISIICLSGKRIPPLTAMTRYLVAHEYGHAVDSAILLKKDGEEPDSSPTWFDKQYARMRNIECYDGYGARHWHKNIGEVIANDFRICVGGAERDFWPHECEHPDRNLKIHNYWYELMLNYL